MLFHEDQRSSQNRYALQKAHLQIPRFHSFGGYSALACIISPADDFGNTLYKEWYFYADNNASTNLTRKITSTNGVTDYTFDSKELLNNSSPNLLNIQSCI